MRLFEHVRWRKVLVHAIVSLAIGLFMTLGIAWGSALLADLGYGTTVYWHVSGEGGDRRFIGVHEVCTSTAVRRVWKQDNFYSLEYMPFIRWGPGGTSPDYNLNHDEVRLAGGRWGDLPRTMDEAYATEQVYHMQDARGWPLLAMCATLDETGDTFGGSTFAVEGGIALPLPTEVNDLTFRVIPLQPIWRGLIVNSVIFGGVIFLLVSVGKAVYRSRRRKVGHCVRCGYDVRGLASNTCPECGCTQLREPEQIGAN